MPDPTEAFRTVGIFLWVLAFGAGFVYLWTRYHLATKHLGMMDPDRSVPLIWFAIRFIAFAFVMTAIGMLLGAFS